MPVPLVPKTTTHPILAAPRQGQRLGSAAERQAMATTGTTTTTTTTTVAKGQREHNNDNDIVPSPRIDANLTEDERAKIRADRAAAAEARRGKAPKKPKESNVGGELRGPNSKPVMTWTA
jgi:hypothetical protein